MATVNPSHLLISRNSPRSPAHPQLVPTFSSRHTLPASFFSDDHVGGGLSGASAKTRHNRHDSAVIASGDGDEEDEEEVDIHAHFRPSAPLAGTVKVVVGHTEFWCHKEILWFASPFFQGLLQGSWAETHAIPLTFVDADVDVNPVDLQREASLSTDTDQPGLASVPERNSADDLDVQQDGAESRKTSVYLDAADETPNVADILRELREIPDPVPQSISSLTATLGSSASGAVTSANSALPTEQRPLPSVPAYPSSPRRRGSSSRSRRQSAIRHSFSSLRPSRAGQSGVAAGAEAVVELHETSAVAFQDFLFWAYPSMECKVSWTNVEDLLALASKLLAPPLQSMCEHFLVSHASGKPVVALRLAEVYNNAELFREASRFVLDQPNWDPNEMMDLSSDTRLRLALRRSWFLERLLKLSSIDVRKEYTCRSDCPDPAKCQAQLDEKWRQAITNVSRYGPPQPSVAFRCLRQLETFVTNPSLVMPHPLCQTAAKSWVMTLFDRMFQPKILSHPLNPGTEKYWLCIALN